MRKIIVLYSILFHFTSFGQCDFSFPESGHYSKPIVIKPTSVCKITYTMSGLIPRQQLNHELNISKTTHIIFQVRNYETNFDTLISRTYLFDYSSKFPALSLAIEPQDLWNDSTGIYCRGGNAFFNESTGHWENCNYQKKWERPVWATYIDSNNVGFSQQVGLRIFGESTRRNPDKSMKLVARKIYGSSHFKYPLFDQRDLKKYKQLVIRTSGNDFNKTRFKDVLSTHLVANLDIEYMAYQPIQLFVNGEHWGLYNLREKINKHYLSTHFKIPKDSINIIMGRWVKQEGTASQYMLMYRFFEDMGSMTDQNYKIAQQMLDIRNYINYRVFQIFINNKDSRGNIRYWNAPGYQEKFRMILYDTDLGYQNPSYNYLKGCLSPYETAWYNPTWSTMYLSKLVEHPEFRNEFIHQFSHLMNTALHKDSIVAQIDYLQMLYYGELPMDKSKRPTHLKGVVFSMEKWNEEVQHLRDFSYKRGEYMKQHLQEIFNLSDEFLLLVEGDGGKVSIADNYGQELPYSGKYFKNLPLKIEALDFEQYIFKEWSDGVSDRTRYITNTSDTVLLKLIYTKSDTTDFHEPINQQVSIQNPHKNEPSIFNLSIFTMEYLAYFMILLGVLLILWSLLIRKN